MGNLIVHEFELIWGVEEMLPLISVQELKKPGARKATYVVVGKYDDMSRAAQGVFDEMRKRKPWKVVEEGVVALSNITGLNNFATLICDSAFEFSVRPERPGINEALRALNDNLLSILRNPRFFTDEIKALLFESAASVGQDAAFTALYGEKGWEPREDAMRSITAFIDGIERAVDDMLRIAEMLTPQGYRFTATPSAFRWTPDIDAIRRALHRFPMQ